MKLQEVLDMKLNEISLSDNGVSDLMKVANDAISILEKHGFTAHVGGSLAKGTLVKKDIQDIDIFVSFDNEDAASSFAKKSSAINFGKSCEAKVVHGSRDYVQVVCDTHVLELIPTVKVAKPEDATNVTDVSLFHVDYVKGEIAKNKGVSKDIALAKAFCQAQGLYGAESYIRGFSGYSLEVLVINFGSFTNFLKQVGKKKVLDPAKHYRHEKDVMYQINGSKLQSPLIVVDPTYQYRNITAGLGDETFKKFLDVASEFLKSPSLDFFVKKEIDVDSLKEFANDHDSELFILEIESPRQEGDIAGTKCLKFLDFFTSELVRNGQEVLMKEFDYSGSGSVATGYVVVKEHTSVEMKGPPMEMEAAAKKFRKEHKHVIEKKGMLYTIRSTNVFMIFEAANRVKEEMGVFGKSIQHG